MTICVAYQHGLLWNVGADSIRPLAPNQKPQLSEYGKIVDVAIQQISHYYENVIVDKYCIMPDHIHAIIMIFPDENGRILSAPTRQ